MFDFAKNRSSGPEVYIHPIPGYDQGQRTNFIKPLIMLLAVAVALSSLGMGGYWLYNLDWSSLKLTTPEPERPAPIEEQPKRESQSRPSAIQEMVEAVSTPSAEKEIVSQIQPLLPVLPPVENPQTQTKEPIENEEKWLEQTVEDGDTLSHIFERLGLSSTLMLRITHSSEEGKSLASIRAGQTLRVLMDQSGQFKKMIWVKSPIESLIFEEVDGTLEFKKDKKDVETRQSHTSGTISSSLFLDGQKAGLSDNVIMQMAEIFGWDIDFTLGLRQGDRFTLIYEEQYLQGEKYTDGAILAAEFINRGTRYRAIRFQDPTGEVGYYTPDGKGMRKEFLKSPVKFTRISSGFTVNRWHPVLNKWRSHKGVDYAAPTGTQIRAVADGKITVSGWQGGYGRVVFIEHRNKLITVYGHMSGFSQNAKVGNLIKQGQVIGYVGQSGLATGPHLHYETRIDGVHRDPLKIKFPASTPISPKYYLEYMDYSNNLISQLALISDAALAGLTTAPQ